MASGAVPSLQISCDSGRLGEVVGEAVALKACGCEPSAQRPVVGSGPVPSLHTSCVSAVVTPEAVAFKA